MYRSFDDIFLEVHIWGGNEELTFLLHRRGSFTLV